MLKSTFGAVTSELKWVYFTLSVRRGLLLSGQSRIAPPPRLSAVLQCQMTIIGSGETHAPPLSSLRLLMTSPPLHLLQSGSQAQMLKVTPRALSLLGGSMLSRACSCLMGIVLQCSHRSA